MPSFRFRGFATASNVALTVAQGARSAGADLVWAQAPSAPNASFTIERIDPILDSDLVAPVALWFTPANITGFVGVDGEPISAPTDPAVNAYDPTASEIFWSWSFGEPDYVPLVTPNIPTAHRDTNRAFTKRPCHVFSSGNKVVTLFGYDSAGNWATATYTFGGAAGDAPEIADPDDFFTGVQTIYFSPAGNFPAAPPVGALFATTVSQVNSRIASHAQGATGWARLRFCKGETYTDIGAIGGASPPDGIRNIYIDAYDDPTGRSTALPVHLGVNVGTLFDALGRCPRLVDQEFLGPYDAGKETGRRLRCPQGQNTTASDYFLYHRLKVSGFTSVETRRQGGAPNGAWRIFSDCDVTNWQDYGIGIGSGDWHAIIGCDIHQKDDALSGTDHGISNSNFANLTSRHGPIRHGADRDTYVACSGFFSRNGWSSNSSSGRWNTRGSTAHQLAYRLQREARTYLNYLSFDRVTFEGASGFALAAVGDNPDSTGTGGANAVFESCLFVTGRESEGTGLRCGGLGATVRNCYFLVIAANYNSGTRFLDFVRIEYTGPIDPARPSRAYVYNNTALILATDAQIGAATRVIATVGAGHNPVIENNIVHGPNLSTALGPEFAPLGTSQLAGFVPRYKGVRFNFPPIGHPAGWAAPVRRTHNPGGLSGQYTFVEDYREGGAGPVADGEWMSIPYPDYTGFCNGALGQVTQAMVLANSGQYHQISVLNNNSVKAQSTVGGRVAFEFTPSAIRVRNTSGGTWTGAFWLLLDLSDYLMDFVPGTESPTSIPAPVPAGPSAAIVPADLGLRARIDFFGTLRPTPAKVGAMEAAI